MEVRPPFTHEAENESPQESGEGEGEPLAGVNNSMARSTKQICYMDSVAVNRIHISNCSSAGLRALEVGRGCPFLLCSFFKLIQERSPTFPGEEEGREQRQTSMLFY